MRNKVSLNKDSQFIEIKGAREHNLKNVELNIPRNQLVVITGVSGSGKSSLAFDTIYAEGCRKYMDCLSTRSQQWLEQINRPDIDYIHGLSPVIAVEQISHTGMNPRSTVATVTEIAHYARLLWARCGQAYCPEDGELIEQYTLDDCLTRVFKEREGSRLMILAPLLEGDVEMIRKEWAHIRQRGFQRVQLDGTVISLEEKPCFDSKKKRHSLAIVVDRLVLRTDQRSRLADSLELAFREGRNRASVLIQSTSASQWETIPLNLYLACSVCGKVYEPISPSSFSWSHPNGACPKCNGLGQIPISSTKQATTKDPLLAKEKGFSEKSICPSCQGEKLKPESLSVKVEEIGFADFMALPVEQALAFIQSLKKKHPQQHTFADILSGLEQRLHFLCEMEVHYLQLNRPYRSLSGGESQRVRLAMQLGADLVGITYILDEPSVGLHPYEVDKLLTALKKLRDRGNSVIVVEHDKKIIQAADYLVELGPGAGEEGGEVAFAGTPPVIIDELDSQRTSYLKLQKKPILLAKKGDTHKQSIHIYGARENNLKKVDIAFPVGLLSCVTGVSGSGKSSLINDILAPAASKKLNRSHASPGKHDRIEGLTFFSRVVCIDQNPIGRSPRSNTSTYLKIFDLLRNLYARCPLARMRGYSLRRFSFNVAGGRCEKCQGTGLLELDMQFLPNAYVPCPSCEGRRYNRETLEVCFKGYNINDVLNMTVEQALVLFEKQPRIAKKLSLLQQVGLGYIKLGQPSNTLSGGEAQRIKLAYELSRVEQNGKTLYLLDEPTTGLSGSDIEKLMGLLFNLRDTGGNTIIIIEHNLDVIQLADWIVDMGPGAGKAGGEVLYAGDLKGLKRCPLSRTGKYL